MEYVDLSSISCMTKCPKEEGREGGRNEGGRERGEINTENKETCT